MGLFSKFTTPKVPRWAFRTGWEDFVLTLREEAQCYGFAFDDKQLADGMIALPPRATLTHWDLRALATHCRDLEPHEWLGQIRESLFSAYGHAGDVELVASAPPTARTVSIKKLLR